YEGGDLLRLRVDVSEDGGALTAAVAREGRRPLPYRRFEWQLPAARYAGEAAADGRPLPAAESAEAFESADEAVFADGPWLRVRTRTDVALLTVR
ncbi:MAG TPA: hypothetical protein VF576_11290, partial [Rubricoccaceae bacterium]